MMPGRIQPGELRAAFEFLVSVAVVGFVVDFLQKLPSYWGRDVGRVALVAGVVLVACRTAYLLRHAAARRSLFEKTRNAVRGQMRSLIRRRAQLVRRDPYGKPMMEKWLKEIDYFITHHLEPTLTVRERSMLVGQRTAIADLIASGVEAEFQAPVFHGFSEDMSPAEFELFCAEELRRAGWEANVTGQSRDQGADVVAEKSGMRVVLQCKLYARPVGNKSVQEAAAARAHERARHGVVVTNNGYTPAADELAATNRILLLHYRDLANLESILRQRR